MLTKDDFQQLRQVFHEELGGLREGLKQTREDIQTLDMKISIVNSKVDILQAATIDGFERVINTMDELHSGLVKRIEKLETHVGIQKPQ